MLNLDSFSSSTVERKLLIKELNLFCDLVENLIQETEKTETRSDEPNSELKLYSQCQSTSLLPTAYVCKSLMDSKSSKCTENDPKSPIKKSVKDKRLRMFKEPSILDSHVVAKEAEGRITNIIQKMEKIQIAPGEFGSFKNWGEDVFLEEKCFPHLFPYGVGGYLSTNLDGKDIYTGFAAYVRGRIMSADPKYRQDYVYLFFLLLVKELIQLKNCKSTYLRQARKLPNLTKDDVISFEKQTYPGIIAVLRCIKT
jgi:hypothetical protein